MSSDESEKIAVIECREVAKVYKGAGAGRKGSVLALDNVSLCGGGEMPVGQMARLRIEFLPGSPAIREEALAPYRPLEKSETRLIVAVNGIEDVPGVVGSLVQAGADITGVALEPQDIEQTFMRLCHGRSQS
ncbi:MAG: hypothetical protein EHM35_11895 [Planctomycetaceae bacterium]|nr:MAG: hypothetical protein EHM35_11895 [Planctomycetaceae bacterium]